MPLVQQSVQGTFQSYVVPLYNLDKQQVGEQVLDGSIFDVPIRKDILHRVVRWQLARRQQVRCCSRVMLALANPRGQSFNPGSAVGIWHVYYSVEGGGCGRPRVARLTSAGTRTR